MKSLNWQCDDKSKWGLGPWNDEPDKVQFMTAAGLPGLILRGPVGALCGYVGVLPNHPLHGIAYNEDTDLLGDALTERMAQPIGEHPPFPVLVAAVLGGEVKRSPDVVFNVHGGLTFSGHCQEPTREGWEMWRASMLKRKGEAVTHPVGDMAKAWSERADQIDDYEAFAAWVRPRAICHKPEPGDPDNVWWFGFDCAHCDDLAPEMLKYRDFSRGIETYRDLAYVRHEVESLAGQLAALGEAR